MADCVNEYVPTQWVNGTSPAINALNLNHIEEGIRDVTECTRDLSDRIDNIDVPVGIIMMFSGDYIPVGWALCDGNNNTPNLINKFVRGGTVSGATGGYTDSTTVSHSHNRGTMEITGSIEIDGIPTGGDDHLFSKQIGAFNLELGNGVVETYGAQQMVNSDNTKNDTFSFKASDTWSGNTSTAGSSGTGKNIPPFYTLMYIMKTA